MVNAITMVLSCIWDRSLSEDAKKAGELVRTHAMKDMREKTLTYLDLPNF